MKIQLITRHYWPDETPAARLHCAIFEHLARQGHELHVFTAEPATEHVDRDTSSGQQVRNGVTIRRIRLFPERKRWTILRLINLIYFQLRAIGHSLRRGADMFLVGSYPPVVPGICTWLVHRITGTPYVYHCLDIQPESAAAVGKLRSRRLVQWLQWLDRLTCERAAAVVTLSDEMAATLRNRGWSGDTLRLINNFHTQPVPDNKWATIPHAAMPTELLQQVPPHSFQVVFAGNMGSFQGLDLLVDAAWLLRDRKDIQFVFMGSGERERELQIQAGAMNGDTVHFIPFQPSAVASAVMGGADLAVLSLLPGVFATAVPSKTMMYLRAGCRVLALIEPDCDVARMIGEHSLGIVPGARQPEVVAGAITTACDRWPQLISTERERIFYVGERLFGYDRTLAKWTRLIDELTPLSIDEPLFVELDPASASA